MADDQAPEGTDTGAGGATTDTGAKPADTPKTFTQADVDALIASQFGDYDTLKAAAGELQTIKDGEKTDLQKALDRAAEAERRAEKAEFTSLREKVANRTGKVVPVASLTGKTEAELIASADALIAWRDENAPKATEKPQKRNPAGSGGGLKSGATGADNGSTDPKVIAAEALRRMRSGE